MVYLLSTCPILIYVHLNVRDFTISLKYIYSVGTAGKLS